MRGDLADLALADRLFAPHYARSELRACHAVRAPLRASPGNDATATSEILRGEGFAVLDVTGNWAWGYSTHDHYVGYVPAEVLGPAQPSTHAVTAPAAILFSGPDIKTRPVARWPMGARFAATADGAFLATEGGWIHARHATSLAFPPAGDPVAIAERLTGVPYLWGGRSGDGIDCSGLVQLALGLAGIAAPRDSDQQRESLGRSLADDEPLARGDLVFFPGHVGFMADAQTLLHANAYWMAVVAEPLADVVARLADLPQPILARKRLP